MGRRQALNLNTFHFDDAQVRVGMAVLPLSYKVVHVLGNLQCNQWKHKPPCQLATAWLARPHMQHKHSAILRMDFVRSVSVLDAV